MLVKIGRRKTSRLKNLNDWYGVNMNTLFRKAANKIQTANVALRGHGT